MDGAQSFPRAMIDGGRTRMVGFVAVRSRLWYRELRAGGAGDDGRLSCGDGLNDSSGAPHFPPPAVAVLI